MITKKQVLKKIEFNKEKLKENGVLKIGIFGSVLKNKQTKSSDIDLIIKFRTSNFDKYAQVIMLLEKVLKKRIDLVTESSLRPEMQYVKKEAEYARL